MFGRRSYVSPSLPLLPSRLSRLLPLVSSPSAMFSSALILLSSPCSLSSLILISFSPLFASVFVLPYLLFPFRLLFPLPLSSFPFSFALIHLSLSLGPFPPPPLAPHLPFSSLFSPPSPFLLFPMSPLFLFPLLNPSSPVAFPFLYTHNILGLIPLPPPSTRLLHAATVPLSLIVFIVLMSGSSRLCSGSVVQRCSHDWYTFPRPPSVVNTLA